MNKIVVTAGWVVVIALVVDTSAVGSSANVMAGLLAEPVPCAMKPCAPVCGKTAPPHKYQRGPSRMLPPRDDNASSMEADTVCQPDRECIAQQQRCIEFMNR